MRRSIALSCVAALGLLSGAIAVSATPNLPGPDQIRTALAAAAAKRGKPAPAVKDILGCYPASADAPIDTVLCSLRLSDGLDHEEIAFSLSAKGWAYVDGPDVFPACPTGPAAETLIRKVVHLSNLEITDTPTEGILTDQRGLMRDRKGPMRLGCTYSIAANLGEFTLLAYFAYADGGYAIDPDIELLPD